MEEPNDLGYDQDHIDLLIELLNVSIHQILFKEKVYPEEIFRLHQKLNVTVYKAVHPEVCSYVDEVLSSLRSLLSEGTVERLVLVIKNEKPVLKYNFVIDSYVESETRRTIVNFDDFQQQIRAVWLTLGNRPTSDEKLEDRTFTFEIHTTSSDYDGFLVKQSIDDLQWIATADSGPPPSYILPVRKCTAQLFQVDIFVEEYSDRS